jgi:hypothetical protein
VTTYLPVLDTPVKSKTGSRLLLLVDRPRPLSFMKPRTEGQPRAIPVSSSGGLEKKQALIFHDGSQMQRSSRLGCQTAILSPITRTPSPPRRTTPTYPHQIRGKEQDGNLEPGDATRHFPSTPSCSPTSLPSQTPRLYLSPFPLLTPHSLNLSCFTTSFLWQSPAKFASPKSFAHLFASR